MSLKQVIEDLSCDEFSTPDLIRVAQGKPYKTDPVFRNNITVGRNLKKNAKEYGIEQKRANASVTSDGVETKASIWKKIKL